MKASLAFAIGLWTGGILVGGVWLFHHRQAQFEQQASVSRPVMAEALNVSATKESGEIMRENARLVAELERLRQTLDDLYRDQEPAPAEPPPPLAVPAAAPAAVPTQPVAPETEILVESLENQALANRAGAVEAIVLATDENYQLLMRLLRSERLTPGNREAVESYLASLFEQYLAETEARGVE